MSLFRHTFKLVLATAVITGGIAFVGAPKASANHIAPQNTGPIPQNLWNYLVNACGHSGQSPAFIQWVSAAGAPATLTVNVPYGAASVPLDMHFGGEICYSTSSVPESRLRIMSASGRRYTSPTTTVPYGNVSVTWVQELWLNYGGSVQSPGHYYHQQTSLSFNAPAGGFTQSGLYRVTMDNRVINRFTNGTYGCVAPGGGNPGGWNYGACPSDPPGFDIQINVSQPNSGTCAVSATGGTSKYPGERFNVDMTANNTGGVNWSVNNSNPNRHLMVNTTPAGGITGPSQSEIRGSGVISGGFGNLLLAGRSTNWTISQPGGAFVAPAATGTYTLQWRIFHGGVGFIATCAQTIQVVDRPYFRTYGGDVMLGAGQAPGCRIDANASLFGVARTPQTGSGSQLANLVLGVIFDAASAQVRNSGANQKELSFANVSPATNPGDPWPIGAYAAAGGGLDAANATCAPDYWAGATNIRPDNYSVTPAESNLGAGQRTTIYVDGDVFINQNITYPSAVYNDVSQIPSFRLIARGNIYVAPGVTELNGLFVAIARNQASPNDGRFYTCYPGRIPTAADMNGVCRTNRLTVYGGVVAELIKLTRSSGSVHTSSAGEVYDNPVGSAAERFIYSPEVWLTSDLDGDGGEFDSLLTLPPVL